ncbi:hypothetical protein CsatB_029721 [Cannabis sativa]|uniref:F-box domain-containing protein n=1 Tax=Cannabis sativa TaxID=3483 RepID=A0A803PU54_CANSA
MTFNYKEMEMSFFCHLPKEVAEEIMLWVPADSLVRLKLLNKSWHSFISGLINDLEFVDRHLYITKNMPTSTSLVFNNPCSHVDHDGRDCYAKMFSLLTISSGDGYGSNNKDHIVSVSEDLNVPCLRNESCRWDQWAWAYHCDGIICLVKLYGTIMLCNPALQESRILPQSNKAIVGVAPFGMGFGYDAIADDYKFVAIWSFPSRTAKAEVYTLRTDCWREINMPQELCKYYTQGYPYLDGLSWRGNCYWLLRNLVNGDAILCFNMCDEEFHITPLPNLENSAAAASSYWLELFVWNDSVALLVSSEGNVSFEYQFFVMNNGVNGACSWTKQLVIGPVIPGVIVKLSSWKKDEFFIHLVEDIDESKDGQLISYNFHTKKIRDIAVRDVDRLWHWACFYVKSLISVKRR